MSPTVNPRTGEVEDEPVWATSGTHAATPTAPSTELAPLEQRDAAVPMSFEEALTLAGQYGHQEAVILDPYEKVNKDKDVLINRPLIVQRVKFMTDRATGNDYANLWIVRDDSRLFRVTDGSTGMFAQISALVSERLERGDKTPYHNFLFPNGLVKSEYLVNEATGETWAIGDPAAPETGLTRAATYYFQ